MKYSKAPYNTYLKSIIPKELIQNNHKLYANLKSYLFNVDLQIVTFRLDRISRGNLFQFKGPITKGLISGFGRMRSPSSHLYILGLDYVQLCRFKLKTISLVFRNTKEKSRLR